MILTLTLNPALDVSGFVDELIPNEKSYVHDELHTPGGNGINSGIIAHRLGAKIRLSGFLGGPNGQEIRFLLDQLKAPHAFISIAGKTRMNLTVSHRKTHQQTRLSFPGPFITKADFRKLKKQLGEVSEGDIVLIGGSLPPGVAPEEIDRLIRFLKKKKAIVFVDCPGRVLKGLIPSGPDFIKPNLVEFQELTGKNVSRLCDILPLARKLAEKVSYVCVTSVEGGALLVTTDGAWFGRTPKLSVRSTVGAGDSFVGAFAYLLAKKKDPSPEEFLRLGLAASAATLTEPGMVLGSKKRILHYVPLIRVKKIS